MPSSQKIVMAQMGRMIRVSVIPVVELGRELVKQDQ
jgi:hypothetical protein